MTNRKGILILFSILALSVLLFTQFISPSGYGTTSSKGTKSALSPQSGKKKDDASKKTVRAAVSMPEAEFAALKERADGYEKNHNITITLENISAADAYAKLKKASQLGEAPDVMLLDNAWVNEFAALGFLQPADEFFTTDLQAQRLPTVMNQVKWNGYVWGVPKDVNPYVLVWNKKLAADNKWDHAPASKDEMIAWNKAFVKPEQGSYGIYFDPADDMALISLATSMMGTLPESGHPLQKMNEAAFVKALQSFLIPQEAAWDSKLFTANYPAAGAEWNPWDALQNDKMAAMVTTISEFRRHRGANLSLAALPINIAGKSTGAWLKGRSFCVSSRSANQQAAADWILDMTGADAETNNWMETGLLPVLLSAYTKAPLRGDEQYNSFAWLVREGKALPFEIDAAKKLDQLQRERQSLQKGEIDLKTFTDRAAKLWAPAAKTGS